MPKFKFAKLVRDKIVDNQIASGAKPSFRQLNTDEHINELVNKTIEEAKEINSASPDELTTEIADVQQALDDLKEIFALTESDIKQAQRLKNDKNGAFKKGHYIEYVEVREDDKWTKYFRANSDRYPEIK